MLVRQEFKCPGCAVTTASAAMESLIVEYECTGKVYLYWDAITDGWILEIAVNGIDVPPPAIRSLLLDGSCDTDDPQYAKYINWCFINSLIPRGMRCSHCLADEDVAIERMMVV